MASYKITAFNKADIEFLTALTNKVVLGNPNEDVPERFADVMLALARADIEKTSVLNLSFTEMTALVDVIYGYLNSVRLGYKKGYEGFDEEHVERAQQLLDTLKSAVSEANLQGYKYPAQVPEHHCEPKDFDESKANVRYIADFKKGHQ